MKETELAAALDADGFAVLPGLLGVRDCNALVRSYDERSLFRSRIVMARHGFGRGEYSYTSEQVLARIRDHLQKI